MGGFLIDTNVISEFVKPEPSLQVKRWFEAADPESLFASVITFGEIRIGIEDLAEDKRRAALEQWLEQGVPDWFQANLLPVTKAHHRPLGPDHHSSQTKRYDSTNRRRLDCSHRHRARVDHCDA